MEIKYFIRTITFLFIATTIEIRSQNINIKLNQSELFKKFNGNWKCELGKDTILLVKIKSYGSGLDYNIKSKTKGNILMQGKALLGYDMKSDKGIKTEIMDPDLTVCAYWFISKSVCKAIDYQDINDPDKAKNYVQFEFKSPNLIIQTLVHDNKSTKILTFKREK